MLKTITLFTKCCLCVNNFNYVQWLIKNTTQIFLLFPDFKPKFETKTEVFYLKLWPPADKKCLENSKYA